MVYEVMGNMSKAALDIKQFLNLLFTTSNFSSTNQHSQSDDSQCEPMGKKKKYVYTGTNRGTGCIQQGMSGGSSG